MLWIRKDLFRLLCDLLNLSEMDMTHKLGQEKCSTKITRVWDVLLFVLA
jgi:hypothetical protein